MHQKPVPLFPSNAFLQVNKRRSRTTSSSKDARTYKVPTIPDAPELSEKWQVFVLNPDFARHFSETSNMPNMHAGPSVYWLIIAHIGNGATTATPHLDRRYKMLTFDILPVLLLQ